MRQLPYGDGLTLVLDPRADQQLADFSVPHGRVLDDPVAAVAAALAAPLEFPPLRQAVVPGDHLVIAVDRDVPQLPAVIAGIVQTLLEGPTQPDETTLLLAQGAVGPSPTSALAAEIAAAVRVEHHDPADRAGLAYLAASKDAQPIYVNRRLFDADMVVPVGCLHPRTTLGYVGLHGGLFPAFSDEATQQRFRAPTSVDTAAHQRLRRQEADEAAWLLGIRFTCQIVPGAGDSILHVLAGDVAAVAPRGRALCEAAWRYRVPQRTSLVVATLVGGPEQQTWENFARALAVAAAAVADGGEIVLCTSLRCAPGPALRHLSREDEEEHARTLRKIRRERSPDAAAAALLLEIRQRARVYLLSGLDGDTVDELGLGHVSEAGEINRLMRRHDSCLLLGDAQRAVVELVERTD